MIMINIIKYFNNIKYLHIFNCVKKHFKKFKVYDNKIFIFL